MKINKAYQIVYFTKMLNILRLNIYYIHKKISILKNFFKNNSFLIPEIETLETLRNLDIFILKKNLL